MRFKVHQERPRRFALSPSERAFRVFRDRLAPLGCKIEFGPPEEGGVFISLPEFHLSDFGPTQEEAIRNFVETAQEVASMQKRPGERWSKDLETQHRLLKKVLG
jgi:hypothetical protein